MNLNADSNQYWNGSNGQIWVNSVTLDKVYSFEINQELEWEDVPDGMTNDRVLMGYSYTGSMTYRKTDKNYNSAMELLFADYQEGRVPDVKIVAKAFNRASGNTQRIEISGITFDSLPIQQWEERSVSEVALDFTAKQVRVLQ